jgi:hypothetical protein
VRESCFAILVSSYYCVNHTVTVVIAAHTRDVPHFGEQIKTLQKAAVSVQFRSIKMYSLLLTNNVYCIICESHHLSGALATDDGHRVIEKPGSAVETIYNLHSRSVLLFSMAKKKAKGSAATSNGKSANGGAAVKNAKKPGTKAPTTGPHWIHLILAVLSFLVGILSPPILQYMQAKSGNSAR